MSLQESNSDLDEKNAQVEIAKAVKPQQEKIKDSSRFVEANTLHNRKNEHLSALDKPLFKEIQLRLRKWLLATLDVLLFVSHVTLVYLFVLIGDAIIIKLIGWSFSDIDKSSFFVAKLFEGVQLLSVLGTVAAYGLHLLFSLYQEGKHVAKVIVDENREKKEEVFL